MVMSLDFAECDRARVARDPSYDGRTKRERRSKNLPSASVWGAANWLACSPGT
jgi:hypothetical protein